MDDHRFDQIARSAAQTRSRRGVVRLLAAGVFGASGLALGAVAGTAAPRRHHHHHHHHHGGGGGCTPDCIGLECGDDGCGGSCGTCGDGQTCEGGACVGGGGGDGLPLRTICDPQVDTCAAGLQCDSPTTRHTCSSTVDGIDDWCCVPPGGSCTECDCCGDNYCAPDANNRMRCICNPEGGNCNGGACNSDDDCNGNTPNCCDGTCVDLLGDANNCGDCGTQCDAGQVCGAGLCGDALAPARHDRRAHRSHRPSGRQRHGRA